MKRSITRKKALGIAAGAAALILATLIACGLLPQLRYDWPRLDHYDVYRILEIAGWLLTACGLLSGRHRLAAVGALLIAGSFLYWYPPGTLLWFLRRKPAQASILLAHLAAIILFLISLLSSRAALPPGIAACAAELASVVLGTLTDRQFTGFTADQLLLDLLPAAVFVLTGFARKSDPSEPETPRTGKI